MKWKLDIRAVKVRMVNVGAHRALEKSPVCHTFAWPLNLFVAQVVQLQETELP